MVTFPLTIANQPKLRWELALVGEHRQRNDQKQQQV
jgi:hypothetical protein